MGSVEKTKKELIKKITNISKDSLIETIATSSVEIMQKHIDDYELIYQKSITKFYSTYKTKKYIRHGNSYPGIKKGINLYRATIHGTKIKNWRGYEIISSVETDKELYQNENINPNYMESYFSLVYKEEVEPIVILSNVLFGIRYPGIPKGPKKLQKTKYWNIKTLTVKTSIGEISASSDTPASLLKKYDKKFIEKFGYLLKKEVLKNYETTLMRRIYNG